MASWGLAVLQPCSVVAGSQLFQEEASSAHTAGEERGPLPMGGHLLASLCFPGRDPEFRSPRGRRLVTLERVSDRVFLTTRMAR